MSKDLLSQVPMSRLFAACSLLRLQRLSLRTVVDGDVMYILVIVSKGCPTQLCPSWTRTALLAIAKANTALEAKAIYPLASFYVKASRACCCGLVVHVLTRSVYALSNLHSMVSSVNTFEAPID
jgi:hypothetical protein